MNTEDLIACAELLIGEPETVPSQAHINRAASTLYYALFHELSKLCADLFMGAMNPDYRRAWQQAYRALAHDNAKDRCRDLGIMKRFPDGIQEYATKFVTLQELRHQCDYDPLSETTKTTISTELETIRDVIQALNNASELDKRAFCSFLLFPKREDPLRVKLEAKRKAQEAEARIEAQKAAQPAIRAERAAKKEAKAAQDAETEIKA